MKPIELKNRLIEYIDQADDILLHMLHEMAERYEIEKSSSELTENQELELDRRLNRLKNGETSLYSWKEIQESIKK